jgi:hypothetical protein
MLPTFVPQHKPKKCKNTHCKRRVPFSCERCGKPVCKHHSKGIDDGGRRICTACCMATPATVAR